MLARVEIDLEDLYFQLLTDSKDVFGLADTCPGDVTDVEQAVEAT